MGAAHVLAYGFTWLMISRPEIRCVTLGRGWFPPEESVSQFKRHAGYVEEPLRLGVVLNPRWATVLSHRYSRSLFRGIEVLTGSRLNLKRDAVLLDAAAATRLIDD